MSKLENKIQLKQFVITAEIVPPLSAAGTKLLHEAGLLKGKVDAINITDAAAVRVAVFGAPAPPVVAGAEDMAAGCVAAVPGVIWANRNSGSNNNASAVANQRPLVPVRN